MSLRDDVLPTIQDGWSLVQEFGFTRWTVTVRTRAWSSGEVKLGTPTESDTVLTPNPWVTERGDGTLYLEGITPTHTSGGYSHAQLRPPSSAGVEYYYVVSGPNGTHSYDLASIDDSDAAEIKLLLTPLQRQKPF